MIANICQRVRVMYAGRLVKERDTDGLFSDPRHPQRDPGPRTAQADAGA